MPSYKLYVLDDRKLIMGPPVVFDADSDRMAIEFARNYPQEKALELWETARLVTTLLRD